MSNVMKSIQGVKVSDVFDLTKVSFPYSYTDQQVRVAGRAIANYDRMVEEIAELKGAIEAAVRIKDLWLPMGAFSDSPPEHYAEIEALHKMANEFEKALAKLNQEGEE